MGNISSKLTQLKQVKTPNKIVQGETPKKIVHESSIIALNATVLTELDIDLITECGKQLEHIKNPLIIIISHKSHNNKVISDDYKKPKSILIFTAKTHKEMKNKVAMSLRQLATNRTLSKYDGIIVVLLAIVEINKYEDENHTEIIKYYYDSTNDLRHVDKTTKAIR
eukprot:441791_1